MKQEQLATLMEMITSYYERFTVSEDRFTAWWEILKDYEFEMCKKNLIRHAGDSAFVPTIADLIKGHKDTSRTYSDSLIQNIEKITDVEQIYADIERRTGRKVIR